MAKTPKRPRDTYQLAKFIVDLATGEESEPKPAETGKDPAAVALGRKGGFKGVRRAPLLCHRSVGLR
jgi:hypothetical protein